MVNIVGVRFKKAERYATSPRATWAQGHGSDRGDRPPEYGEVVVGRSWSKKTP